MDGRNSSARPGTSNYGDLDDFDFDRPPPPKPQKRLQRISRSSHGGSQHQQATAHGAPRTYNHMTVPAQQRGNTIARQRLQRESYQPPNGHLGTQYHPSQFHSQQQQQQAMYSHGRYQYNQPPSPSTQSDFGGSMRVAHPPGYPRASTTPGGPPTATHQSNSAVPYPSAMTVGGGMPSNSRIMPSAALVNAVASTDINRHQRERDLANALGRRRPTQSSVSSSGSADHMQSNTMSTVPELPFNGNVSMDFGGGMHGPGQAYAAGVSTMPQGRYMGIGQTQGAMDMRVGRSASSASSNSGYRGGAMPSPYGTQHRQMQAAMPESGGLRKQVSAMSMNTSTSNSSNLQYQSVASSHNAGPGGSSADLRRGYPGSRSAPDLNLDAMRAAVTDVARNMSQNPMPQIPAAYANNPAYSSQPPAQNLSIRTDMQPSNMSDYGGARTGSAIPTVTPAGSSRTSESGAGPNTTADVRRQSSGARTAGKSCMTGDTLGRNEPPPINQELTALLENVQPVYPAMLSLVAKSFYEIISQVLQKHVRNGLEHAQCFTGRDAVDAIYTIIRASDRNLAIVVGRALEQQKLFHDVDYEKRLRDDPYELYAFDEDVVNALLRAHRGEDADDDCSHLQSDTRSGSGISGVFVMLTDCYSPTCSNTQPCYSVTCPRQRLQQDHLRRTAKNNVAAEMKQEKLWSMSVPKEIVKSVSRKELDRQERIFELFYGEKDYVRDLCILRDLYMKPLHNGDIVGIDRRKNFITKVFKNALAVLAENMELHRTLERRQKESFICYQVGDVMMPFVENLEAYLEYCANQPYSMHFLEAEKRINSRLVDFLEKTDRRPECRKLGVQHFLTRPPTRLARYPLLLRAVLKYTPEGHPDRDAIPQVIDRVEDMLNRINVETGKAQNRLRLFKVDEKLVCSVSDRNDLRLTDDQRKLVRDSQLRKRGGENTTIQVLLLDHMLLMCKVKADSHTGEEKYTLYKRPIPLQMLTMCIPDDPGSMRPRMAARRDSTSYVTSPSGTIRTQPGSTTSPTTLVGTSTSASAPPAPNAGATSGRPTVVTVDNETQKDKYAYPLQITYLGRNGFTVTLYASKQADRKQWYQSIEQQQQELMDRHCKFELVPVAKQFPSGIRINTADVYDHGRCVVIGTDHGLYLGVAGKPNSYQRLSHLKHDRVYQIEIHEKLNVMAMIADKDRNLYVYPLDHLMTATTSSRHGLRVKPLHTHVSFFRFGQFQEQDILCSVRSTTLSNQTIIHVYKPVMSQPKSRTLGRFLSLGGESGLADSWKCIKECYIAAESTSLHFLRSRLCVGCTRGFEIVDLATMNTQSLLDPADTSLGFINKRDTTHPIALFRVHDGQFLLCYDVFAFYVNRNGQRARSNWMIHWVGTPTSFKFEYPYILAFDSQFIEIYHVETGSVVQVIITGNCASLSPNKMHVNLCVTSQSPTHPQEVLRIQHLSAKDPI
ncbi:RHO1 GDP-GTP exchange protein 2 [Coemansia brasiliensis]|uniref:RHO1 GDP-GTP exchange protein 2 n=1 Tax=Coemansia brasiliensis TaxID=2650707 RepID=A0A9W8LZW8_9FUNG|nr:RHO1 GDP-GTP exchange protein 2 [Coemansia brasiliensis]